MTNEGGGKGKEKTNGQRVGNGKEQDVYTSVIAYKIHSF